MPSNRTIIGVAILLFGAVLLGVGMHHLIATGTCSSTGYSSNLGPVPHCPKGTGWWILFLIGGIFIVLIGGFVSMGSGAALIVPGIFGAIGIGSMTVAFQDHPSSSTKTFALIFGGAFALAGLVPALFIGANALRKLGRSSPTGSSLGKSAFGKVSQTATVASPFGGDVTSPDAIMGAYAAGTSGTPSGPGAIVPPAAAIRPPGFVVAGAGMAPSRPAGGDALDKIAKLAELRKSGALTEDEFNREKAKLLGEI